MRFLADQDVWAYTLRTLRKWGHDVVSASEIGLSEASDLNLLKEAHQGERILITRDRDFGRLVFLDEQAAGIVFLRITPRTMNAVHNELAHVVNQYSQDELLQAFVVVEPGQYRIRQPR